MPDRNDRNPEQRRQRRQRLTAERRKGGDRRAGAYKTFARQLPDRFVSMSGSPRERVLDLVQQYCLGCDESLQADLAQALLPTLQTIVTLDGGVITEGHRKECETVVERCVRQNELATGRWTPACEDDAK